MPEQKNKKKKGTDKRVALVAKAGKRSGRGGNAPNFQPKSRGTDHFMFDWATAPSMVVTAD